MGIKSFDRNYNSKTVNITPPNEKLFYFKVQAVNSAGTSGDSDEVSISVQAPPAAPTNVKPAAGNGQVTISWDAVTGADSYIVYYKTSLSSWIPYGTVTGTSRTIGGLQNGTTYFFIVYAINAAGQSPESDQVSAVPQASSPFFNFIKPISGDVWHKGSKGIIRLVDNGMSTEWVKVDLYKGGSFY